MSYENFIFANTVTSENIICFFNVIHVSIGDIINKFCEINMGQAEEPFDPSLVQNTPKPGGKFLKRDDPIINLFFCIFKFRQPKRN